MITNLKEISTIVLQLLLPKDCDKVKLLVEIFNSTSWLFKRL